MLNLGRLLSDIYILVFMGYQQVFYGLTLKIALDCRTGDVDRTEKCQNEAEPGNSYVIVSKNINGIPNTSSPK